MRWLVLSVLAASLTASDYTDSVGKWRADREAKLKAEDGWLSVSGLTWLKPGNNPAPGGVMRLEGEQVTYRSSGDGKTKPIRPDSEDFVAVNGVKLFVIHRGQHFGVRVKDNNSEYRKGFTGLEWFPVDPSWRVEARFIPFAAPQKKLFDSQQGDKQEMVIPGVVEFVRAGQTFRLSPILEGDEFFVVFRDKTAGKTTYPAARFLYSKALSKPGQVELDFNKAYNPPCAFTPYATCPLPPKENRMTIPVEAGEKNYKTAWHSK